ncbi:hypothetical protein CBR_g22881 [Chara braunii]|uniref:Uncharacterized protein n=1 Tax=Chara braunii TaxID=69332 RepID=A0A388L2W7_CHABU|nr:hypothetical protein CBR_g22881 [Chara braunii]|eukprot:GBG76664.1 hypothetical protein CBR_g22881 [Chara braunii]
MSREGPWITTILDYDGGAEVKLKINMEGAKEEEMRVNPKLQATVNEAKDRAKKRCRRNGMIAEMRVIVAYHKVDTSTGTVDREQAHLDRDSGGESEMSEAKIQSYHDLEQWRRDHLPIEPVERGPEADSRRQVNRQ